MSTHFTDLLGDSLQLKKSKKVSTSEALAGKSAIGLYFSASWCPPCKTFTPKLAKAYSKSLKAKGLEIVFVSADRDEKAFDGYFKEMPWLALPYEAGDVKNALSKKYEVDGIPTLVIVDSKTGEVITTDGRESVGEDPMGKDFPWRLPPFWKALGSDFLKGMDGETVDVEQIKGAGKVIGLYFSAHWCGPCRAFTPTLAEAYTKHLKAKGLEIIFVSSDRDAASFQEYYKEMPWLALPNGDPRESKLSKRFGVSGIPSFVLVDASTGETINGNARGKIVSDPEGQEFPFWPSALNSTEEPEGIEDDLALCVLLEGCDDETTAAAKAVLEPFAAEAKKVKDKTLFFYGPSEGGIAASIREMTKVGDATPTPKMVLLDIPDEGGYYVSDATKVTKETLTAFLDAYKAKSLTRQQLV